MSRNSKATNTAVKSQSAKAVATAQPEVQIQVVKVASKEEATIRLLTQPVGDGIRRSNNEITAMLTKTFGSASINCVRWYSSKLRKDPKYAIKYKIEDKNLNLTPRKDPVSSN